MHLIHIVIAVIFKFFILIIYHRSYFVNYINVIFDLNLINLN
jgi:hypothetical protein